MRLPPKLRMTLNIVCGRLQKPTAPPLHASGAIFFDPAILLAARAPYVTTVALLYDNQGYECSYVARPYASSGIPLLVFQASQRLLRAYKAAVDQNGPNSMFFQGTASIAMFAQSYQARFQRWPISVWIAWWLFMHLHVVFSWYAWALLAVCCLTSRKLNCLPRYTMELRPKALNSLYPNQVV